MAADNHDDLGQDYRPPDQTAVATAPQPVRVTPPTIPQGAVAPPRSTLLSPEDIQYNEQIKAMGNIPIGQAEQALSAALKFQGMRGYQQSLREGKSSAEALAQWAPLLFAEQKTGGLTGAANLIKATQPRPPTYRTASGQVYEITPQGARALTSRVEPSRANQFDLQTHRAITSEILKLETQMNELPVEDRAPVIRRIRALQQQADQIKSAGVRPPAVTTAPVSPVVRAPMAKPTTPEAKLQAARALRAQHPDWTKKQIIDAVNQ